MRFRGLLEQAMVLLRPARGKRAMSGGYSDRSKLMYKFAVWVIEVLERWADMVIMDILSSCYIDD
jgi:hypothetical protein